MTQGGVQNADNAAMGADGSGQIQDINENEELNHQSSDLRDEDGNFDDEAARIKASTSYKLNMQSLRCPDLEHDPMFRKLKEKLVRFYVTAEKYKLHGPSKKQIEECNRLGVNFDYMMKFHQCLKKMVREIIITDDKQNQLYYLK